MPRDRKDSRAMVIRSYARDSEPLKLIGEAINVFYTGEVQHDMWSRDCHILGFQGLKRWHRIQSEEDRRHRIRLQHMVIDIFGVDLDNEKSATPRNVTTLNEYYKEYLDWEIHVYETINMIANKLVELRYNREAEDILKPLLGVRKEIEKIRRNIQSAEQVEYDMSYLKIMDKKLHDKCKEKEGDFYD